MNIYRTEFEATCPNNDKPIKYSLEIMTGNVLMVEDIRAEVEAIGAGYHEHIADLLSEKFRGSQRLKATHHGVDIETIRPHLAHWSPAA